MVEFNFYEFAVGAIGWKFLGRRCDEFTRKVGCGQSQNFGAVKKIFGSGFRGLAWMKKIVKTLWLKRFDAILHERNLTGEKIRLHSPVCFPHLCTGNAEKQFSGALRFGSHS